MFGPEPFDGYYGDAFRLRFPDYRGPVAQATIRTAPAVCNFGRCGDTTIVKSANPNQSIVVLRDTYSPYMYFYSTSPSTLTTDAQFASVTPSPLPNIYKSRKYGCF